MQGKKTVMGRKIESQISLSTSIPAPDGCQVHHQTHRHGVGCCCFIIPLKVLKRFAKDPKLPSKTRKAFADAAKFEQEWRKLRVARTEHTLAARAILPTGMTAAAAARPPTVTVFDCAHNNTLPGAQVGNPGSAADSSAKQAFKEATAVADFYQQTFGRNSVDDSGMTLISSIHYSVKYNNAFWFGTEAKWFTVTVTGIFLLISQNPMTSLATN
jgi:hypothetical protein